MVRLFCHGFTRNERGFPVVNPKPLGHIASPKHWYDKKESVFIRANPRFGEISWICLPALRPVEEHPGSEVITEVDEAMIFARGDE